MAEPTRRSFVQWLLGMLGSVPVLGPLLGCRPSRLADPERAVLAAACERVLPSNDGPGAREAGVMEYITRALATRYHAPLLPVFREGARRLDAISLEQWGMGFCELAPDEQDRVLTHAQRGGLSDDSFDSAGFFHGLLELTLEGFLGDPVHGGNRGEAGWQYIGYTPGGPRPGRCHRD